MKFSNRKTWNGFVALRENQLNALRKSGEAMVMTVGDETMIIPPEQIDSSITDRSSERYFDKFSNELHYLYYFKWKPSTGRQEKLPIELTINKKQNYD